MIYPVRLGQGPSIQLLILTDFILILLLFFRCKFLVILGYILSYNVGLCFVIVYATCKIILSQHITVEEYAYYINLNSLILVLSIIKIGSVHLNVGNWLSGKIFTCYFSCKCKCINVTITTLIKFYYNYILNNG